MGAESASSDVSSMHAVLTTVLASYLAAAPTEPLPANADPIAQVRALHDLGMTKFLAADYEGALIAWKQAFVLVSHEYDHQAMRAVMVTNMIAAHRSAYEVGRNPEHLVEAMRVIDLRKAELAHYTSDVIAGEALELDTQRA